PGRRTLDTVTLGDGERHEAVIGGRAQARLVHRKASAARFAIQPRMLGPGSRLALDLKLEELQVLTITRRLVSLRLERAADPPGPVSEYARGRCAAAPGVGRHPGQPARGYDCRARP